MSRLEPKLDNKLVVFDTCYMCGSPMEFWGKKYDWGRELSLVKCPNCGVISTEYVDTNYYSTHYGNEYWFGRIKTLEDRVHHDYNIAKLRLPNILKIVPPPGKLLDIGASNGSFLVAAKEEGYDTYGIELDDLVINFAQRNAKCPILKGPVTPDTPMPKMDVITMHDVVEHLIDPKQELGDISDFLVPHRDGLLVIDTPDFDSKGFKELGIDYHHIRPYEHMHCLKKKHFTKLFDELGLDVIEIDYPIPGKIVYYLTRR